MAATGARADTYAPAEARPTAWTGWIVFAAIMMVLLGAFQVIEGLVALFRDDYFIVGPSGLLVEIDYTAWGWVHLILGVVLLLAGFGLLTGNLAAQIAGIALAVLSAIVNLAFIAAYPLWGIIIITLDVIIIYAIAVHGREVRAA
jgi:vacuolar-type H+-ATPase subunit I/STV1